MKKLLRILEEVTKSRVLFRAFNIPVEVPFITTFFFLGIFAATFFRQGAMETGRLVARYVLLFSSITLHEFGHSLTARKYGHETKKIQLLPIGACAVLENMDLSRPRQELAIAIAGPAVTNLIVIVSGILYIWLRIPFLKDVCLFNIVIFIFNMLPVFPMDGGRVLRALASMKFSTLTATKVAVGVGSVFYVGFIVGAFLWNAPMLGVVGFLMGAGGLYEISRLKKKSPEQIKQSVTKAFWAIEMYDKISPKNAFNVYMFALGMSLDEDIDTPMKCIVLSQISGKPLCDGADCMRCRRCKKRVDDILSELCGRTMRSRS